MTEVARISEQLRRSFEGGAWHGPSVRDAVNGVDAELASARPVPEAHSIWEIALHLAGWLDVVRRRVEGETVAEPDEGDWPAPGADDAAWRALVARLEDRYAALYATVKELDDEALARTTNGGSTTVYVLVHGQIQHNLYHAGQIALLKKSAASRAAGAA